MTVDSSRILYEDDHLLAVNKLAGELVVRGKGKMDKLPLLDFLKKDYPGLRAVHRLDAETTGVVVFAKNKEALEKILSTNFDQWKKTYQTLVMGRIERRSGVITKKLPARSHGSQLVEALTRYTVLDRFGNSTYVECEIETGRHHQIRKHFASINHPLVMDKVYGHKKFNGIFRQEFSVGKFFLHASSVTFPHPITGKKIHIEAPLPKFFASILKKLRSLR